jgi:NAD(P)-dependent dehydrogenase (short-subunit alcohol dehydrogenase family)
MTRGGGKLANRSAIVTGASQGLGLEIARAFVREGARVLICARDEGALRDAARELGNAIPVTGDVSREEDVRAIVARARSEFGSIDVLVNNAGVYGPMGPIEQVGWSEWVRAIEINLFGSALMCRQVLPVMRERRYGKILQLSGGGATKPMPRVSAYAASKAAVVRFAETLAEETRNDHIDVNAVAPGALNTRMLDQALEAGPERTGDAFHRTIMEQKRNGGASLQRAADLCVFLASAASDGITGKLISAVWDPWESLAEHKHDLTTDVFTLRRVERKDRGFDW